MTDWLKRRWLDLGSIKILSEVLLNIKWKVLSASLFRDLKKHRILQVLWRNIRTPTQRGPGQWIGNNLGAASGSGVCVFIFIYINCVCIQAPTRKRPGQQFGNKSRKGSRSEMFAICHQFSRSRASAQYTRCPIRDRTSLLSLLDKRSFHPTFPKKDASRKLFW